MTFWQAWKRQWHLPLLFTTAFSSVFAGMTGNLWWLLLILVSLGLDLHRARRLQRRTI